MKSRSEKAGFDLAILDHAKVAERIEAEEVRAGVLRGSWRYTELRTWQLAIQDGLRKQHADVSLAALRVAMAEGTARS